MRCHADEIRVGVRIFSGSFQQQELLTCQSHYRRYVSDDTLTLQCLRQAVALATNSFRFRPMKSQHVVEPALRPCGSTTSRTRRSGITFELKL